MGKNKLKRFAENTTFDHVFQPSWEEMDSGFELAGKWKETVFENQNPIVLELGCGKGEYSLELARRYPDKNFIGIDIKGARFWRGAKTAEEKGIDNVAFLRARIQQIDKAFVPGEISEIWITFPDPQIKFRRAKHRLTHPDFLKKYNRILTPDGRIHLKTDSEFLYGYTQGILQMGTHPILISHHDIYHPEHRALPDELREIQTHYEKKFLKEGKKITYIRFTLNF